LGIEVLSPNDPRQTMHRKLDPYFEHGTRLVWIVNWKLEQIHSCRPDSIEVLTRALDVFSADKVLPGFESRLSQVFSKSLP